MGRIRVVRVLVVLAVLGMLVGLSGTASAKPDKGASAAPTVRFATFNASLARNFDGQLMTDLATSGNSQASAVAEIIQRTRPDVLLVNEFDYDAGGVSLARFQDNYLSISQNGAEPIDYPYSYAAPSNTGIHSGFDLDNNGVVDPNPSPFNFNYANDSFGFGWFPGQFGMAVYSMYPIDTDEIRTFQNFLWRDMPGALLPEYPNGDPWFTDDELEVVRLSSKSHWDLPIEIGKKTVHFLVSHPTPPVFDGPEDRNGTRNHDEIRFWADYVRPGQNGYIYDDDGSSEGLKGGEMFVIAGDQNADPFDGDSTAGAAQQLLDHPRINSKATPTSQGGVDRSIAQNLNNDDHLGDPAEDTADFSEENFGGPGNLRVDYVLPSKNLQIRDSGVFWPADDDPLNYLTGSGFPVVSSDHRLVWVDVSHGAFR
ncbi:MAG: endonuclease/exonuclease/phosphatase family protein [Acidimicrobiales bacterium]